MSFQWSTFLYCVFIIVLNTEVQSQDYVTIENIQYRSGKLTEYMKDRCRLDVYKPVSVDGFATVVWFHGGAMKAGNKFIPEELQNKGVAVVAVNYRLYPKVKYPEYLHDAAAAVAWTLHNIEQHGGLRNRVFVSGHSAGGYLTTMIGLDTTYLAPYGIHPNELAGLIPFSGHSITHMTVREQNGIDGKTPVIDQYAPLAHLKKDTPPILLITGDRDLELLGRYEETAYFWRMMKINGNENITLEELDGFNHGNMFKPACFLLLEFMEKY